MTARLNELCRLHGIVAPPTREGEWIATLSPETQRAILTALGVDVDAADAVTDAQALEPLRLRVPEGVHGFLPSWLAESRAWGVAVQLYELRTSRNWGIGDFSDLVNLAPILAGAGADFIGLNPLHALFGADPSRCSPFSPSSRRFLNPLYIAVDQVDGYQAAVGSDALSALRALDRVDYGAVARMKRDALKEIWRRRLSGDDFEDFIEQGGEGLRLHCLFEALSHHFASNGGTAGWRGWPAAFQDQRSKEVAAFAQANDDEIHFQQWLQYLCHRQLGEAQHAARNAGMRIGLYLDLAVGEAPDGSAAWSAPSDYVGSARIGAPPDMFSAHGQDWGLTGVSPLRVRETRADALRSIYEAAMRHAGAVRLDHVMGVWQLFLIPEGREADEGAYVRLPAEQVITMLADLSARYRAVLVGEDLGVVPDGFREVMREARILSYRVLYFEQDEGGFTAAESYPPLALACVATHDLPTMRGWWKGSDIDLRERFGLVSAQAAAEQRQVRAAERLALGRLLVEDVAETDAFTTSEELPHALVVEAHRFISATPSRLAVARLADLAGEDDPTNVPGTAVEYPNWQLKCSVPLEELAATKLFQDVTAAMASERPRQG